MASGNPGGRPGQGSAQRPRLWATGLSSQLWASLGPYLAPALAQTLAAPRTGLAAPICPLAGRVSLQKPRSGPAAPCLSTGFLSISPADFLDRIILCGGSCLVHFRIFSSIPGPCPPGASSTPYL